MCFELHSRQYVWTTPSLPSCSLQSSAETISFPHDSHLSYINSPLLILVSKLINVFFFRNLRWAHPDFQPDCERSEREGLQLQGNWMSLFASSKIIDFWDTRNPKDFSVYQMRVTICSNPSHRIENPVWLAGLHQRGKVWARGDFHHNLWIWTPDLWGSSCSGLT